MKNSQGNSVHASEGRYSLTVASADIGGAQNAGMGPEPEPTPEIPQRLQELDRQVNALSEAVEVLRNRLSPVTQILQPIEAVDPMASFTSFGFNLAELSAKVETVRLAVEATTANLEL